MFFSPLIKSQSFNEPVPLDSGLHKRFSVSATTPPPLAEVGQDGWTLPKSGVSLFPPVSQALMTPQQVRLWLTGLS